MNTPLNKFLSIMLLLLIIILSLTFSYIYFTQPSDEDVRIVLNNFIKVLSNSNIDHISIYVKDEFGNSYKIDIIDKKIIKEILNASQTNYQRMNNRGQYKQYYTIRLYYNGIIYNFGYGKMDEAGISPCDTLGINYYNDCGQIYIHRDPYKTSEDRPAGSIQGFMSFTNIDLIPVLRKYIDKEIINNPSKYIYILEDGK